jgi:hypothetical protein
VLGAYLVISPREAWSLVPILFFIPVRLPAHGSS